MEGILDRTYNGGIIILVGVGAHVPDNLMCKELRELGSLHDESFYIPQHIIAQALYNLWNIEESDINRM